MAKNKQSRRTFLDWLLRGGLTAWFASIFYPVFKYMIPPDAPELNVSQIEAGTFSDFPKGSSKIIRMGRIPVIVLRKKNGDFKALEATCTHLDCTVQFKTDTEQIWCACHNGYYDVEGRNISGPPPRPLGQFNVTLKDDKVIITKQELA